MSSTKSIGRIIGMLLFVQLVVLTLGFILLLPITTPAFLEDAAGVSLQIRAAVLLLFAGGALTIGIALAGFPVFREYSHRMALWFLACSIIWFSMQAVDNIHILSLLSLSQQYTQGGASNAELFGALATAGRSTRRLAHYTELLVIDSWFFVLYGLLFRFSLVPRALAGFGLIMVLVHTTAITLPTFIGYSSVLVLAYSLALSYLAVGTWLVVKGFDDRHGPQPNNSFNRSAD
ncbi:MAG: DUF4386 domain-containing protein [Pyrinomonadaceae bacterium]